MLGFLSSPLSTQVGHRATDLSRCLLTRRGGEQRPTRCRKLHMAVAGAVIPENVIDILEKRGLIEQMTFENLREVCEEPISVYCGFDPTADSLHLGNYMALVSLRWFQLCGHRPVAIVGGATGKVGDPSGKSAERPVLSDDVIQNNLNGIRGNITQVVQPLEGHPLTDLLVLNNHDWIGSFSFLEFLRDVGKYARVGTMLAKDSVKTRLNSEDGMSFTEFAYQLLQAYDFMYLHGAHGVTLQLGGSDQWGNITAGTELARKVKGASLYGATFPLLTKSDGKKFGKSEGGALWLSADKMSPYQLYQYLVKTSDEDVCRFLRRLTFMDLMDIDALEESMSKEDYKANSVQKVLAEEVTRIIHGEEGVKSALAATMVAAPGKAGAAAGALNADALEAVSGDMPNVTLSKGDVVGQTIVDVLVKVGLQSSKGEARRLIKNGGGYLNNAKVSGSDVTLSEADLIEGRLLLLAAGKKSKMLVRVG